MANSAILFDKQPSLSGSLVTLRPLEATDFDDLYAVASDPEIWALHPAWNRYQLPIFRVLFEESLESGGAMIVIDNETGEIIGSSRFHIADATSGRAEIGWSYLARSHWGGQYNSEIKALMLAHAFRFVDTVYLRVGETNLRSRRAVEKIGGKLTDKTDIMILSDGKTAVHVIFEVKKADVG